MSQFQSTSTSTSKEVLVGRNCRT